MRKRPALLALSVLLIGAPEATAQSPGANADASYRAQRRAYDEAYLKCEGLWNTYRWWAQDSINDAERASHYNAGAAKGFQSALDAAREQFDAMTPQMPSFPATGGEALMMGADLVTGGLVGGVTNALQTQARLMQALMGIRGAGILETMAEEGMRNSAESWRKALEALNEWKRQCPPVPPKKPSPPPPDVPPFPDDEKKLDEGNWKSGRKDVFRPGTPTNSRAVQDLLAKFANPAVYVRHRAARALAKANADLLMAFVPQLRSGLKHLDPEVRFWSLVSLGRLGARAAIAVDDVIATCTDADPMIRALGIGTLERLGVASDPGARAAIERASTDNDPNVRSLAETAAKTFARTGPSSTPPATPPRTLATPPASTPPPATRANPTTTPSHSKGATRR